MWPDTTCALSFTAWWINWSVVILCPERRQLCLVRMTWVLFSHTRELGSAVPQVLAGVCRDEPWPRVVMLCVMGEQLSQPCFPSYSSGTLVPKSIIRLRQEAKVREERKGTGLQRGTQMYVLNFHHLGIDFIPPTCYLKSRSKPY